jgi:HSP20 family protein
MAQKKGKKEVVPHRGGRMPSIFDQMDRLFESFMGRDFGPRWLPSIRWPEAMGITYPSVDVYENDKQVTVKAELPGVKKEDLDINITEDEITLSGEKKREEKVEEKDYYRLERSHGSFTRKIALPAEVQSAKARASFRDGMLEITVPKKAPAKKKMKVRIE